MSKTLSWAGLVLVLCFGYGCPKVEKSADVEKPEAALDESSTESDSSDRSDDGGVGPASTERPQLCEIVTPEDVTSITGKTYESTNSQADYATISHCEYRNNTTFDVVTLLYASGETASQRMEQAQLYKPKSIDGFLDAACWEPARGVLSATHGDHFVEVGVSKTHGEENARIELAKKLANRVLESMG